MAERRRLDLVVEAFNLFNHPNILKSELVLRFRCYFTFVIWRADILSTLLDQATPAFTSMTPKKMTSSLAAAK